MNSLQGKKILIANTWNNKFNKIYGDYFSRKNQVKIHIIESFNEKTIKELFGACQWADIIWTQWASFLLEIISNSPFTNNLFTSIRSYEILSPEFSRINWSKVSGAIYCGEHIKTLANQLWGNQLKTIPQKTIFDCVEVDKFPMYSPGKGFHIAFIGRIEHKKGIPLLIECIRSAVLLDSRFKFHVVGQFNEKMYQNLFEEKIEQLNLIENIILYPWINDIPEFFREKNYILCTSPWEGCPNNIIEGLACGVKPIIHNWFGAEELYPNHWIFNTIDEFLRLLTEDRYDTDAYRDYAKTQFNSENVNPIIDSFIAELI